MDEHQATAWHADLEALFGDRSRTMSAPRLMARRVGEIYCDALVKQGYLNTRLSYRELFWFPVCAGFCGGSAAIVPTPRRARLSVRPRPFEAVLGTIVRFGNCRWDGAANRIPAGELIPLVARLAAVVKTYASNMASNMPENPVIADHLAALDLVCARAHHELDPELVDLFVSQSGILGQQLCAPPPPGFVDAARTGRLVSM